MTAEVMSLRPVPKIKPRNAPKADFTESVAPFPAKNSSKSSAPRSEPKIMPTGGYRRPRKSPAMAPQLPYLLPPVSLVNQAGTT